MEEEEKSLVDGREGGWIDGRMGGAKAALKIAYINKKS